MTLSVQVVVRVQFHRAAVQLEREDPHKIQPEDSLTLFHQLERLVFVRLSN